MSLFDRLYGPDRIEPRNVNHCGRCLGMRWLDENDRRHIETSECESCVVWLLGDESIVCACGKNVEEH